MMINPKIFPKNMIHQRRCEMNDSFSNKEDEYERLY